jgi:lysophospholipase
MQLVATPRNPVPIGAVTGMVTADGPALRYAIWEQPNARGTVFVFQGRAEFIEKYFETVADLLRRRFSVVAVDWRGQGGSERLLLDPRKGHVSRFADYENDIARLLTVPEVAALPKPFIAVAHSMGGCILLRAAAQPGFPFTAIMTTAPMVEIHRLQTGMSENLAASLSQGATLMGLASNYVPGGKPDSLEAIPFEGNGLTTSEVRFSRNQEVALAAPELLIGAPTLGWLAAALAAMRQLRLPKTVAAIQVPVLCFEAENDTIVSSVAAERYCESLKFGTSILVRRAQHEILQERDDIRAQFWAAFDAFFAEQVAAA